MKLQAIRNKSNKSSRGFWMILIMSFAVFTAISGLVTGGIIWHKQPSFCATCHTPMTNYVQNYFGGDTTLLITKHASCDTLKLKCVDCHESLLSEQVREGMHWITGNYTYPLENGKIGNRSFCMATGCHVESKIIEATKNHKNTLFAYNQHDPRHGKQECSNCHSMHGTSVLTCNQCHKYELPEGWISPQPNGVIAVSKK